MTLRTLNLITILGCLAVTGCDTKDTDSGSAEADTDTDTDADTDTDTDTDADTDTDTDADADTDTDTDTDTTPQLLLITDLKAGNLVISEIMYNPSGPSDSEGEWFEVYNPTSDRINLNGLEVRDNSDKKIDFVVNTDLIMEPGAYTVFGRSADMKLNGGITVDFSWDNPKEEAAEMGLNNSDEILFLQFGKLVIDQVEYNEDKGWPEGSAYSLSLNGDYLDAASNDDVAFWCLAETMYSEITDKDGETEVDYGTPGVANDACPDPIDDDGDGFSESEGDCDDADNTVYPGAEEIQNDGIDQDCNGADLTAIPVADLEEGDLIVTEVMNNPAAVGDSDGEYLEVYNTTGSTVDLSGLEISDAGSDSFTVSSSLELSAGGYAVFCINADSKTNGGVTCDYEYSGTSLGNGDDEVILGYDKLVIDAFYFDDDSSAGWTDPSGASRNLDPDAFDATSNDSSASWCDASSTFGDGDAGTPGAANDECD